MSAGGRAHDALRAAGVAASWPIERRIPYDAALLRRSARRRARGALAHAAERIPLYRERLDAAGLDPREVEGPADLARLPLLERRVLHEDPDALVSDLHPRESLIESRSSGSSGMPISFWVDRAAMFEGARLELRQRQVLRKLTGKSFGHTQLGFANPRGGGYGRRKAFQRVPLASRLRHRALAPTSALMPLDEAVATVATERPDIVSGFGSYVEALFERALELGERFEGVRLVRFGGDSMSPAGRELIERRFGIPVRSVYSAIEAPLMGFECEAGGGFHLNVDLLPVRVVDADGRDLPPGETGEVVVSNLFCRGTVLINYRLGDRARLLSGRCPCGRVLPRLGPIEGRAYDWLLGPDGERVHPEALGTGFRRLPAVRRFQIVQSGPRRFVVRVVGEGLDPAALAEQLRPSFERALGAGLELEVVEVARIEPGPSGKVKRVVREPEAPGAL